LARANEHKKDGEQDSTSKGLFNMMMNNDSKSNEEANIVDSETLVSQTQDRLWRALKRRFQYDVSLQSGQEFLLNHVSTKIPLVITYADLVGSTNMSMTLPADKLSTIIRAFT
jgi:adenylate cyclase